MYVCACVRLQEHSPVCLCGVRVWEEREHVLRVVKHTEIGLL